MTSTRIWIAALIAVSGLVYACGSMSSAAGFDSNTRDPNGGASDAGTGTPGLNPSQVPPPVDNAVILVHAAKSQSFRLCFMNELDGRPQPDSQVMPEANVVGVEVGSAVRLGPLKSSPGEVFLFDEPLIRAVYPQFGGAGAGPTCRNLLSSSNPLSKIAVSLGTIDTDLSHGVHLLVVRGCPANGPIQKFSVAECGASWDPAKGNLGITELELSGAVRPTNGTLPAQVVNLSQPLEGARAGRDVVISFGDLVTAGAKLETVTSNPPLFGGAAPNQPAELAYPAADLGTYATSGFRVQLVPNGDGGAPAPTTVLDQSLVAIQVLSSPRDVPPSYYAAASNYALLMLGDPNAKLGDGGADSDERRQLHFLAVAVIETKPDAGAPRDGGRPIK